MISALAIGYLFLGGSGAGALFVLCIIEWLRCMPAHDLGAALLPSELLSRSLAASLLCLVLGVVFLVFDLGNPDAILFLLLTPQPVALTVGAFSLPIAIACAASLLIRDALGIVWRSRVATIGLCLLGVASSLVVMTYTGVFLQDMASVVAWQTPLVPIMFALSSLSCGMALILGSTAFVETRVPLTRFMATTLRTDSALIVVELAFIAAFLLACLHGAGSSDAAWELMGGSLAGPFWIGLVGMGLLVPLALEHAVTFSSHRHQLVFIAAAVLFGGLMMRVCIVGLAPFDVAFALTWAPYDAQMAFIG